MVNAIPDNCTSGHIYLVVKDARKAMEFCAEAFDGKMDLCMEAPAGSVMHGEVKIGNSTVMLSAENPQWGMKSPVLLGGSPASIQLYVQDADASFAKAVAAGCTKVAPVETELWGDRYGKVADPFGYQWGIATHVEDVSPEEMVKRSEAWFVQMAQA